VQPFIKWQRVMSPALHLRRAFPGYKMPRQGLLSSFTRRNIGNIPEDRNTLKISQNLGNKIGRLFTFEDKTTIIKKHKEKSPNGLIEQYLIKTKAFLVPNGYGTSTNKGYGRYVSLQALAYIFASTSSVLSMQCLLFAMGLGENSLPLAATLNWVGTVIQHLVLACIYVFYF
jgi:hypothetical protein